MVVADPAREVKDIRGDIVLDPLRTLRCTRCKRSCGKALQSNLAARIVEAQRRHDLSCEKLVSNRDRNGWKRRGDTLSRCFREKDGTERAVLGRVTKRAGAFRWTVSFGPGAGVVSGYCETETEAMMTAGEAAADVIAGRTP